VVGSAVKVADDLRRSEKTAETIEARISAFGSISPSLMGVPDFSWPFMKTDLRGANIN
jgi:hypothetical protein